MDVLPAELFVNHIFTFIDDPIDLLNISLTCKYLYDCVNIYKQEYVEKLITTHNISTEIVYKMTFDPVLRLKLGPIFAKLMQKNIIGPFLQLISNNNTSLTDKEVTIIKTIAGDELNIFIGLNVIIYFRDWNGPIMHTRILKLLTFYDCKGKNMDIDMHIFEVFRYIESLFIIYAVYMKYEDKHNMRCFLFDMYRVIFDRFRDMGIKNDFINNYPRYEPNKGYENVSKYVVPEDKTWSIETFMKSIKN